MPEYDFSGKVAFVTGAAHGQGESHAVTYAENGADVVAVDVPGDIDTVAYPQGTREELDETVEAVEAQGQDAIAVEADVRDEDQVEAAVEEALDAFGHIDFLANNAGILSSDLLVELDERKWDQMLDTNLKGVWLCSKHVGKHFIERGEGGKIVTTSSTGGTRGSLGRAGHYGAAKWGVRGLTKTLALELADYGVNANCVVPTGVDTPMVEGMAASQGQEIFEEMQEMSGPSNILAEGTIEPRDVSEAYMWLCSDAARFVTGSTLRVDAGDTAK